MANLQQASTSGTQTDKAPVYDSDGSAEVHDYENFYDNEIFNMFTQEEQYTELLKPIPEPHQVPQNDNNIIFGDSSVEKVREHFFIIAVQTLGSGISIPLAVGTPSTGSGNLYCQWELSPSSGNALCILFPTAPHYLLSLRNEDTIFDPGICNSYFSRPNISHRCGTFPRFKVLPESPMEIFSSTCSPMDK
nr:hypothetical protein [Tanacetum cinerariifolium]